MDGRAFEMATGLTVKTTDMNSDIDINDVFDSIVLSENNLVEEGFNEGFQKGSKEGKVEGFHLGYHRGAETGAEIGFYKGIVEALLALRQKRELSEKADTALKRVLELIDQFPKENDKEYEIIQLRDLIRAKYKKACSLLKIDGSSPDASKLSF